MLHYFPTPHILGKRGRPHHQSVPFMRALKKNNTAKIRIKRVKTPRHLDDQKSKDRLPMQISWIQGNVSCVCVLARMLCMFVLRILHYSFVQQADIFFVRNSIFTTSYQKSSNRNDNLRLADLSTRPISARVHGSDSFGS